MIFNHDPPKCFDCWECGGSSRCGMGCSALMSNDTLGGYPVCTTIGSTQSVTTNLIDKENPGMGVVVEMGHQGPTMNCSLTVSVICDSKQVQGPKTLERVGNCNFATQITHPAGCANVLTTKGNGLGWFSTLLIILLCLFGVYLVTGCAYRFFYLNIRGIDIIPNLEFWASLPHRVQLEDSEDPLNATGAPTPPLTFDFPDTVSTIALTWLEMRGYSPVLVISESV
ncbi:hypothetical protein M8C21_012777 [Ambrosia artemisiifolia]|uniref:Uncharacterized protein n=1 Tax=Ambrosia artemisiifolia TaxID=4212 RepID=A0AAD5D5I9_AMBAR|nr:hypothetical protein M8C21_012777 [Ambrosia artemisiifolia]